MSQRHRTPKRRRRVADLQSCHIAPRQFPDLARRYSLSPDARVGGDLGFFARGTMPPAFDEVVFKLNVGGTSEVVSTEYGFHLFRVLEKKPGRKREFTEVRGVIEERMLASLRSEAQKAYVAVQRAKAAIEYSRALPTAAAAIPSGSEKANERPNSGTCHNSGIRQMTPG